jgi:hypothetical protein
MAEAHSRVPTLSVARPMDGSGPSETQPGHDAIREQLERVLRSQAFRNSKRNCNLLRYLVERTLDGHGDALKERTIGVEIFGRTADYDTSVDHTVRSTVGEMRKRLAQYYMEPARDTEVRIEVPSGSYVPQFRLPLATPARELAYLPPAAQPARFGVRSVRTWVTAAAGAAAMIVILALGIAMKPWSAGVTSLDRFWNPVLASPGPILLCTGTRRGPAPADAPPRPSVGDMESLSSLQVHIGDATALAHLSGLLQSKGKPFRILSRTGTTFGDLQEGPAVLIGALNNDWTLRLSGTLRFNFEVVAPGRVAIVDKKDPSRHDWSLDFSQPYGDLTKDYALISRVRDPKTEQTTIIAGGIAHWGTLAAGEFLTNPAHFRKLESFAPKDWERKNLQVVLSTNVINGSSGPPSVVDAYFW